MQWFVVSIFDISLVLDNNVFSDKLLSRSFLKRTIHVNEHTLLFLSCALFGNCFVPLFLQRLSITLFVFWCNCLIQMFLVWVIFFFVAKCHLLAFHFSFREHIANTQTLISGWNRIRSISYPNRMKHQVWCYATQLWPCCF